MIKKIKNLLKQKTQKAKRNSNWVKNGDGSFTTIINSEVYLEDKDGMHMVYVHTITIGDGGAVRCDYTSSSDLEGRNLIEHLNKVVLHIFFKAEDSEDVNGYT